MAPLNFSGCVIVFRTCPVFLSTYWYWTFPFSAVAVIGDDGKASVVVKSAER